MQFAATVVLIVAVVMCVARWLDSGTVGRTTVRIDQPVLEAGRKNYH